MVVNKAKGSKKSNEVKSVENINKNPQSFLKITPLQKEVPPSHKFNLSV